MKKNGHQYKIEKNKGMPRPRGHTRPLKYPWNEMDVGDSILIESQDKYKRDAARLAAYSYGKRKNMRFETRWEENGLRIWRTK